MGVYRLMATPALFGLFHSVACCIYLRSFWWTVHLFHLHEWANSDWLRLWLGSGDINEADAPLIASPVVLWPMITNEGENVLKIPFFLRITDEREHQFSRWIRRGTLPGRGRPGRWDSAPAYRLKSRGRILSWGGNPVSYRMGLWVFPLPLKVTSYFSGKGKRGGRDVVN